MFYVVNFVIILPLFAFLCFLLLARIPKSTHSYSWILSYLAYFCALFYWYFLPLPLYWQPQALHEAWLQLEWNPFFTWSSDWQWATASLSQGHTRALIHLLTHYVGSFLFFVPLADFLYTVLKRLNRRIVWLVVLMVAICLEALQFLLAVLTGQLDLRANLTDAITGSLGAGLFLFLSYWLDRMATLYEAPPGLQEDV